MLNPKPETVLELFENHPERWIQRAYATNAEGDHVSPNEPKAICWCLVGAIRYIYLYSGNQNYIESQNRYHDAQNKIESIVFKKYQMDGLLSFNDSHEFNEVLDVVRKAGV